MSKNDPTIGERQERYIEAQAKRGMKQVKRWAPESKIEKLDRYIEKLKKEAASE